MNWLQRNKKTDLNDLNPSSFLIFFSSDFSRDSKQKKSKRKKVPIAPYHLF